MYDLTGRTILITGGKGRLGTSWTAVLEKQGAEVIVWDLPEVDVTDLTGIVASAQKLPPIDGLINAAAIDSPPGSDPLYFEDVMKVNVEGAYNCCKAVIPRMVQGAAIVNIASLYALVSPWWEKDMAYGPSKAALVQLTRQLACKYPQIRVNSVCFGGVEADQPEAFKEEYAKRCPLGRMARVDEYDDVIMFLLTTTYMTGSNLIVDGGWTA